MLGSHSKKFLFFHVYKVAGTSIRSVLSKHSDFHHPNGHFTPSELIQIGGQYLINKYTSFAFVRNPWDWQVSLYHFMLKDINHFQHNIVKDMSFDEYLEWRVNEDLSFQYSFLSDNGDLDGEVNLSFIGKYEYLESDFNFIMNELGIDEKIPHYNKSNHRDYKTYYDEKSKKLVENVFKKDIEFFGYTFNNKGLQSGLDLYGKNSNLI